MHRGRGQTWAVRLAFLPLLVALLTPVGAPPTLAADPPPAPLIEQVSKGPGFDPGDANSTQPSVSADGRYVAFSSKADNLSPQAPSNPDHFPHIWVYDRETGINTRITPDQLGGNPPCPDCPGSDGSYDPSISADGTMVAYTSKWKFDAGDFDIDEDVFVQSIAHNGSGDITGAGPPQRVSYDHTTCSGLGEGCYANQPSLSGNGHYVAFTASATFGYGPNFCRCPAALPGPFVKFSFAGAIEADVFLADTQNLVVPPRLISQGNPPAPPPDPQQASGPSNEPSVNIDGTLVAYTSTASNLAAGVQTGVPQVFRRHVNFGQPANVAAPASDTVLVSSISDGREGTTPTISEDGQNVAYIVSEPRLGVGSVVFPVGGTFVYPDIDFGNVQIQNPGDTDPVILAFFEQNGTGRVDVNRWTVTGPNANEFHVGRWGDPPRSYPGAPPGACRPTDFPLMDGNQCYLEIDAVPGDTGPRSATMTLFHNPAPDATSTVLQLHATGTGATTVTSSTSTTLPVTTTTTTIRPATTEHNGGGDAYKQNLTAANTLTWLSQRGTTCASPCPSPAVGVSSPTISGDGSTVAWVMPDNDLERYGIYRTDTAAINPSSMIREVTAAAPPPPGASSSAHPSVTRHGELVAFDSDFDFVVPSPTPLTSDVFVATYSPTPAVTDDAAGPGPLTFGDVTTGVTSAAKVAVLTNNGVAALTISSISYGSADYASDSTSTCAPGGVLHEHESCTVRVLFTPTTTGVRSDTMTISVTQAGEPSFVTMGLTGNGTPLDFGSVQVGTTATQPLLVTNTGATPASVNVGAITGTDASDFGPVTGCAAVLQPGQSCSLTVAFHPSSAVAKGPASFPVTIGAKQLTVTLKGTGVVTPVSFSVSPSTFNFGNVTTGATSTPLTVTVTNTGSAATPAPAILGGVDPNQFSVTGTTCGALLQPNATCTVTIVFKPTTAGSKSATLFVGGKTVTLTGTGVSPPPPGISVTPNPLTWGDVPVGITSSLKDLTVTSTGPGALTISSVAVTTGSPEYFILSDRCTGQTLTTNQTCGVTMVFTPSQLGDRTGEVTIVSNAGTTKAALGGKGVAITITADPNPVDFGSVAVGEEAAEKVVTITIPGVVVTPNGNFSITGPNASDFHINSRECTASSTDGSKCVVRLGFKPAAAGDRTATLTGSFGASQTPFTVALKGAGGVPVPSFTPNPVDFGSVLLGAVSAEQAVTVANKGDGKLTPGVATISGDNAADFTFVADNCNGKTLLKDQSCTVVLRFSPATTGARTATLNVPGVGTVTLNGTGAAATPPPTDQPATPTPGNPAAPTPTPTPTPTSTPTPSPTPNPTPSPGGTTPAGTPTIRLSRPVGAPGEVITVEGSGFQANSQVTLQWVMDPLNPQTRRIALTTVTTDASGSFAATPAVIFTSDPAGPRVMQASAGTDQSASAPFLVVPATMQRSDNVALNAPRTQLLYRR